MVLATTLTCWEGKQTCQLRIPYPEKKNPSQISVTKVFQKHKRSQNSPSKVVTWNIFKFKESYTTYKLNSTLKNEKHKNGKYMAKYKQCLFIFYLLRKDWLGGRTPQMVEYQILSPISNDKTE